METYVKTATTTTTTTTTSTAAVADASTVTRNNSIRTIIKFPQVKRPARDAGHPPPSRAEVANSLKLHTRLPSVPAQAYRGATFTLLPLLLVLLALLLTYSQSPYSVCPFYTQRE